MAKTENRPSQEEIARKAFELFEQSGRTPGRDMENWLAAESQLMARGKADNRAANTPPNQSQSDGQRSQRPQPQAAAQPQQKQQQAPAPSMPSKPGAKAPARPASRSSLARV